MNSLKTEIISHVILLGAASYLRERGIKIDDIDGDVMGGCALYVSGDNGQVAWLGANNHGSFIVTGKQSWQPINESNLLELVKILKP